MKRSLYLLFAIALVSFLPTHLFGQLQLPGMIDDEDSPAAQDTMPPQRVGVPPVEVELSNGEDATISGYCFDEYLIAPRKVTRFENVLAGKKDAIVTYADGHTSTLDEAVKRGDIDIRAYQLDVTLRNKSRQDLAVNLTKPVVFWDRPAGDVNPDALNVLNNDPASNGFDYNDRQHRIWRVTTAERLLGILGYDEGSRWNYNSDRINAAASQFQKGNGMPVSGTLDNNTIDKLAAFGNNLRSRLRTLGFRDYEGQSMKEDLAAQIRAYQRYLGATPTGRWSQDLTNRFASDEQIIPQVRSLAPAGKNMLDVLKEDKTSNVLTYLNGTREMMVLTSTQQGTELWSRTNRSLKFKGRDNEAVNQMDELAAQLAGLGSKDENVVIYPHVAKNGMTTLAIGKNSVEVDQKSLAAYLKGGAIPEPLANALAPLTQSGGNNVTGNKPSQKLIVYRGPFVQGRGSSDGRTLLATLGVEQIEGNDLARALDRTYGDRTPIYVSDDLRAGARSVRGNMGYLGYEVPAQFLLASAR
jgi:hypothetical protein